MALPPLNDTITAIATAPGVGAVGIVRLSGPDSFEIAEQLFVPKGAQKVRTLPAGRIVYGDIRRDSELVDESLLLTFRAPHSYTAQDVIEFQTHGGPAVLRRVLELCQQQGARLAGPGEFTLRAYLNGRLDLVQAEAVLDLVNAQSESARRNAALGLSQALSRHLDLIQDDLTGVYGNIQAFFDYPDEGLAESEFTTPLERALTRVRDLLATAKAGDLSKRGARLAFVGQPNAGKSSLLNALLGYQRSIVSDIPGTTRDYLEAPLSLGDIPITVIDTAGIRATEDAIEASGVDTAWQMSEHADLSMLLIDQSAALTEMDFALVEKLKPSRSLVIASKADLQPAWSPDRLEREVLGVSAKTGEGVEQLKARVREMLIGDVSASELWISSERHAEVLKRVETHIERALLAPDDLAALDLEEALRALASITGRGDIAEETLAHIFANFCVGK